MNIVTEVFLNIVIPVLIVMGLLMEVVIFISIISNIQSIIDCHKMKGDKKNGFICRHSRK